MKNSPEFLAKAAAECAVTGMHSPEEIAEIVRISSEVAPPGNYVEFGCASGACAVLVQIAQPLHNVWLYDSFQGLPDRAPIDGDSPNFTKGSISIPRAHVLSRFRRWHLPRPTIVPGWFSDVQPCDLPESVEFALIDCDLYQSVKDALTLVIPLLSRGSVVMIHDYEHPELPGVKPAVLEFIDEKTLVRTAVDQGGIARLHYFVRD